ncbi:Ger(x)C family spore germination protein [Desulfuribacillus alkaliarsenatis]|uniref:Uncharacterized protein n=1 Tax=Desulfuribacillus alkaliarsenatis TaxID=766136 RepID=A0A1E5G441_9FIRM|nr:Ger(x)C family spore germination protein [Desulfuribacillus alkaliarsenatis]OEF97808.1 hypothetical protein BHF68_13295 [Desulfuribacillus alkaliarsenatis]
MRQTVVIIIILIMSLTCSGCWNRQELDQMDILLGAGLDIVDNEVLVAAQVARAGILAADVPQEPAFRVYSATGRTVFDAIRNVTLTSANKMFWGHHQVLLIGEEFAKDGIMEGISFFARDHEVNRFVDLVLFKGDIEEVMNMHVAKKSLPMLELRSLIENYAANAKVIEMPVSNFMKINSTPGICVVVPILTVNEVAGQSVFKLDGTALIAENKLVGELTANETRGLLWLLNRVKSAILVIDVTETAKKNDFAIREVSLEVLAASTKIVANGNLKFTVESEVEVSFGEDIFREKIYRDQESEIKAMIEEEAAKLIEREIERLLEITQELQTDPAGFGRAMYRQRPNEWREIEAGWCEETYPSIEVSYDINVSITGRMMLREYDSMN